MIPSASLSSHALTLRLPGLAVQRTEGFEESGSVYSTADLRAALEDASRSGAEALVLDFIEAKTISNEALGILMTYRRLLKLRGTVLTIRARVPVLRQELERLSLGFRLTEEEKVPISLAS